MGNIEIGKYGRSFGLSFAITSLFSALLVVLKETSEHTVMAWMKAALLTTGLHIPFSTLSSSSYWGGHWQKRITVRA